MPHPNETIETAEICGKPGDTHPSFPATVELTDGRLLMVFTSAKQHMENVEPATAWKTYSADGGARWTRPEQIILPNGYETTPAAIGLPTAGPLAGHPILTTWSVDEHGNKHTEVVVSTDVEGNQWGEPVDLNETIGHQTFSASPIVQVDDTHFQQAIYVAVEPVEGSPMHAATVELVHDGARLSPARTSVIAVSEEGAAAGVATNVVRDRRANGSFSEVGMVTVRDGRLLALVRNDTEGSTVPGIWTSWSSDGGQTWTTPIFAFHGSGAPRVALTADGGVVVLYRHTTRSRQPVGDMDAVYRVSGDDGASWGPERPAGPSSRFEMAYGTPIPHSDGTVTFVYSSESDSNRATMITTPRVDVTEPAEVGGESVCSRARAAFRGRSTQSRG